jgi:divalent metal cation (Fe/Co/Zn/Cd) transporter
VNEPPDRHAAGHARWTAAFAVVWATVAGCGGFLVLRLATRACTALGSQALPFVALAAALSLWAGLSALSARRGPGRVALAFATVLAPAVLAAGLGAWCRLAP